LPIIVTGTRGEKQEAMNSGADAFLSLPVEKNSLQDALAACAAPRSAYRKSLTVLRLHYSGVTAPPQRDPITEILSTPPQIQQKNINYRILEADDPSQAELLQRIWHPDVLLLTGEQIPRRFIQELSEQETLCNLPIVCLDAETAQLAHQVGKLSVYPCLNLDLGESQPSLWSVLQFAAGINPPPRQIAPYVVVVDGKRLRTPCPNVGSEWLNAFIQYLATAGYRSSLAHSWGEVYQQVQQQGADLLLLDLEGIEADTEIIEGLRQLSVVKNLPIIAIASPQQLLHQETLYDLLKQVTTKILPGHPQSMQELLLTLKEQLTSAE
jgi:CheY-like chemotaxis protein